MPTEAGDEQGTPAIDFQDLTQQARLQRPATLQAHEIAGSYDAEEAGGVAEQERWHAHNKGIAEYYELRKRWSRCLKCLLILLVVFQCFLVLAVGFKWMDFGQYQAFLKIQAGVYFVQIVSLCVIVIRFLFNPPVAPKP